MQLNLNENDAHALTQLFRRTHEKVDEYNSLNSAPPQEPLLSAEEVAWGIEAPAGFEELSTEVLGPSACDLRTVRAVVAAHC